MDLTAFFIGLVLGGLIVYGFRDGIHKVVSFISRFLYDIFQFYKKGKEKENKFEEVEEKKDEKV